MEPYEPLQTCNGIAKQNVKLDCLRRYSDLGYGTDDRHIAVQFPALATDFTPFRTVQSGSEFHPASCSLGDVALNYTQRQLELSLNCPRIVLELSLNCP